MKNGTKKAVAAGLAVAMVLGAGATAFATSRDVQLQASFRDIQLKHNGEPIVLKDEKGNQLEAFGYNESTYAPVRAVAEALGYDVEWDGDTNTVSVNEAGYHEVNLPAKVDRSTLPRVIITTDMEVDDTNGVIMTLLYANEFDIAGLISTAGMWHFNGDGEHTLAEITPNYKCNVVDAGELKEFRPAEPGLIRRLIDVNYRADYEHLSQNNPNYPTPDELLSVYKEGNIQFEGDVREETDGSRWIEQCILDDDPRTLYIHHWGGSNTTVRALLSIYEDYYGTEEWDEILNKVVSKVVLVGTGEDNCIADQGIMEKFPGLQVGGMNRFFSYGSYGAPVSASEELLPYYQSEYLTDAIKFGHGELMGEFHLVGDGQVIYGEPMVAQYGLKTWIDWKELRPNYSNSSYLANVPRWDMDRYDWMCIQFSGEYIDIGLRQDVSNSGYDHYTAVMFDELAARADWAVMEPELCNHAPIVTGDTLDFAVSAGATVSLSGAVSDPDGDNCSISWWVADKSSTYAGDFTAVALSADGASAQFTVPADAASGDTFVVNMEVQDDAERPMTRFAQFVITVD